jgi:NADH:ubiquinone oxidoreductase subunit 5 (subunit L)/multisubunit Na+/H+ antiporter MnhA subunit
MKKRRKIAKLANKLKKVYNWHPIVRTWHLMIVYLLIMLLVIISSYFIKSTDSNNENKANDIFTGSLRSLKFGLVHITLFIVTLVIAIGIFIIIFYLFKYMNDKQMFKRFTKE